MANGALTEKQVRGKLFDLISQFKGIAGMVENGILTAEGAVNAASMAVAKAFQPTEEEPPV